MDDRDRDWIERRFEDERRRLLGALGQVFKELIGGLRGALSAELREQTEQILRKADEMAASFQRLAEINRKLLDEQPADDAKENSRAN